MAPCGRSGRPRNAASCASNSPLKRCACPSPWGTGGSSQQGPARRPGAQCQHARQDRFPLAKSQRWRHLHAAGGAQYDVSRPAPVRSVVNGAARRWGVCDDVRHSRLHERTANHRQSVLRDYARRDARDHARRPKRNASCRATGRKGAAKPAARFKRAGGGDLQQWLSRLGCSPKSAAVGRRMASGPAAAAKKRVASSEARAEAGPAPAQCCRARRAQRDWLCDLAPDRAS